MDTIYEVIKMCLLTGMIVASPIILTAMVIGTFVSVGQSITSIQEQTLSFVPKLLGCIACIWLMAPWMLQQLGLLLEECISKSGSFYK